MKQVVVHTSIMSILPTDWAGRICSPSQSEKCSVFELEIEIPFIVHPGEPRTYEDPGCDPEAEEIMPLLVKFPDGSWFRLNSGLADIFDEKECARLHSRAIEVAAEQDLEDKAYASECREERKKELLNERRQ